VKGRQARGGPGGAFSAVARTNLCRAAIRQTLETQVMKKQIEKPLKLNRETLIALDGDQLTQPVGRALTQLHNQCITMIATHCSCVVVNTHCIES
jgi:hypothetical protein